MRSAFAPVALPLAALIASLLRWWLQGSGNLYTAIDKRFYVPDPDLGWRVSSQHPIWLGLEVIAVIAAIAAGLAAAGWIVRRVERTRGRRATALRVAAWIVAAAPLAVPIAAFASGAGPLDGRDVLPARDAARIETGIAGSLALPGGRYDVVAHEGSSVTVRLSAGGEAFDARFGDLRGAWQADPRSLAQPMTGEVSVAASTIDTGIEKRSEHARDGYLKSATHPRITWKLDELVAARQDGPDELAFRAKGSLGLLGRVHPVEVVGTLKKPDAAALGRLGVPGAVLLVQADFALSIKETALAPSAGDFDRDHIAVHVSLVLRHASG